MDKNYSKINKYSKKLKAIRHLGGKCKCGEDNLFKLTFHHRDNKEYKLSNIRDHRWSKIKNEIEKCELLCHNCHRELHHNDTENSWNRKAKINLLELYGNKSCEECGYDKCISSLSFHHIDDKEITIGNLTSKFRDGYNEDDDLVRKVVNELNKCILLCTNCHFYKHANVDFFEKNKEAIYERSLNIKEIQSKIDRNLVKNLYLSGLNGKQIAEKISSSKGTISDILKELGLK